MKQILQNNKYNIFSESECFNCGCKDWMITTKDQKSAPKEEAKVIHACPKLKVWQIGLKRFYEVIK
jgi:hypothetical protein